MDEFRKFFPKLFKEIVDERSSSGTIRKLSEDPLKGYVPNVYDFLGRVRNVEEGLMVIDYLEKRGELNKELADGLRKELVNKGVEAFGERREFGYYFKLSSDKRRESKSE